MSEQTKSAAAKAEANTKEAAQKAESVAKSAAKAADSTAKQASADMKAVAYEMPEAVRQAAETSVQRAREAYDRLRTAAEDATDMMEDSYSSATRGFTEIQVRAVEAAKANSSAYFDFARDMMGVRSMSEMVELQSAFARSQFEQWSSQFRDMTEITQKVAKETAEPMRQGLEKSVDSLRTQA